MIRDSSMNSSMSIHRKKWVKKPPNDYTLMLIFRVEPIGTHTMYTLYRHISISISKFLGPSTVHGFIVYIHV